MVPAEVGILLIGVEAAPDADEPAACGSNKLWCL